MKDKERIEESTTAHLYIAIRRKKENSDLKEICFRHVIRDEGKDLEFIKQKIAGVPGVWRIYKTVNARNFEKARKILITKLVQDPENWMYRVDSLWKTCLLQPKCRAERKYLLDIDTKDFKRECEVMEAIKKTNPELLERTETPNGVHIVLEKFDTRVLEGIEDVEFKRDGYVFVERITNE